MGALQRFWRKIVRSDTVYYVAVCQTALATSLKLPATVANGCYTMPCLVMPVLPFCVKSFDSCNYKDASLVHAMENLLSYLQIPDTEQNLVKLSKTVGKQPN